MRRRVDRERGFVAEEVAGHGRQHEGHVGVDRRHTDGLERSTEATFTLGGDHDRCGPVRPVDGDLLGHVVGVGALQSRRAHEHQRLGREVDVLLVLGRVERDRLVAELRRLDPHLGGGDAVAPVADDRPVATRHRVALRDAGDGRLEREHLRHRVGQRAQRVEDLVHRAGVGPVLAVRTELVGDGDCEQIPRRDLRVERLGRRHRHLDVTSVGRVEHAVGLVDQVAVATVDDRKHRRAARGRGRTCGWCRWWCRSG